MPLPASVPLPRFLESSALAVLSSLPLFLLLADHRGAVGHSLVLGLATGLLAAALVGTGEVVAWQVARRRPLPLPWLAGLILAVACLPLAALAVFLEEELVGMLAVVGWGLPLPALVFAARVGSPRSPWPGLGPALLLASADLALALFGPVHPRPDQLALGEERPTDLLVLSWNVGNSFPKPAPSQEEHLDHIAGVLRDSGAHVACLQEVASPEYLGQLLHRLGTHWVGGLDAEGPGYHTAVLSRVGGRLRSPYPENPDAMQGPTSLELGGWAGHLEIVSVHFAPARNSGPRLGYARWLADHAAVAGHPVLVAGDLNLDPEGAWDRLTSMLTDDVEQDGQVEETLRALGRDVGQGTASTGFPARRIDRMHVPEVVEPVSVRVLFGTQRGRMDHRPVLVRLRPGPSMRVSGKLGAGPDA